MMKNGDIWQDTDGVHINAHGGGILAHAGRYYWFGEHKTEGWEGRLAWHGVHAYSSSDLVHWRNEGVVLAVNDDPASPICRGCRIERPKVVFNQASGKFVMWFHSTDANHTLARSGVAVADAVTGPYRFLYARRPDQGRWPLNATDADRDPVTAAAAAALGESAFSNGENEFNTRHNILGRDVPNGQMARDMNLFVDDDGTAYHIHASEHNGTLHIARLTGDYLDHAEYVRVFPNRWMEAPAMFRRRGRYYLLMSGCTSWEPNAARGAVAEHPFGPWREIGNPCRGTNLLNGVGAELTFGTQSTFVFRLTEDFQVAMFDAWNSANFIDSRHLWLPIVFTDDGYEIPWEDYFNPSPRDGARR